MNTTYTPEFRFKALAKDIEDAHQRWGKYQPTAMEIANSVKSWRTALEVLAEIPSIGNRPSAHKAAVALEEAWERRDNRALALKAVGDACKAIRAAQKESEAEYQPIFARKTVKAVLGADPAPVVERAPVEVRVKAWVENARAQLRTVQTVPQDNKQYIAYDPYREGSVYAQTARRVKSWLENESGFFDLMPELSDESTHAFKAIADSLTEIEYMSRGGLLDQATRRAIHARARAAFKALDYISPAPDHPAVKIDVQREIAAVRDAVSNLLPMLQSGQFGEDDVRENVAQVLNRAATLPAALPIKAMPADTGKNIENFRLSLIDVIDQPDTNVRVKAVLAALDNLELIASDAERAQAVKAEPPFMA